LKPQLVVIKKYRMNKKSIILKSLLTLILLCFVLKVEAQDEAPEKVSHFRGNISVTHNGISLIPTFSLGRPAATFELSLGGERLSFDPEFRIALDGKPWSFVFWLRYKLVQSENFKLHVGAHPAMIFQTVPHSNSGSGELIATQRFLAGEIVPTYSFSDDIEVGLYYLTGFGLEADGPQRSHMLAVNSTFTNLRVTGKFFLNLRPQVFYLKIDDLDGYYANASVTLARKEFPIAIAGLVNRTLKSDIPGGDWVWNVSLVYTFNNEYIKRSVY
jgi:hypothetical protein